MVKSFLVLPASIFSAAPQPVHMVTRDEVLALAKRDSSQFCSGDHMSCEFSASPSAEDGWSVLVLQVSTAADGRKGYPVGGHHVYIYTIDGKLLRDIPGL